jgi:hypothetical protein
MVTVGLVVKMIAESLSQHGNKDVLPSSIFLPLSHDKGRKKKNYGGQQIKPLVAVPFADVSTH